MEKTLQKTQRNYLWDNIKTFLIFTVVIGHCFENFVVKNDIINAVDYWIYTFHMPAFLFVSGYWSKGYCKNGKCKSEKVGNFIAYFAVFQVVFYLIYFILGSSRSFNFFFAEIGLWYLLAMIAYYLLIPLAEKLPAYIVLPVLIFLGLTIDTLESAGTFLSASRTFVFAPFFFMGYYTPEKLIIKLRSLKFRYVIGIASAVLSVAIWGTILLVWSRDMLPMRMFYGKHSFAAMGFTDLQGVGLRIIAWTISLLMILSLLLLFSEKKNALSYIGKNTLPIYILHFIPFIILRGTGINSLIPINSLTQGIIHGVAGIGMTFLFAMPVFNYPFVWIQKLTSKIFSLKST